MSKENKQSGSSVRRITDTEYELIKIILELKEQYNLSGEEASEERVKIMIAVSLADNKMRDVLAKKFGSSYTELLRDSFGLKIVSGHFVEITYDKHNISGK